MQEDDKFNLLRTGDQQEWEFTRRNKNSKTDV